MTDRARFFREATWTGGVVGLGYVGLPLAVTMVARGLRVVGFDVSERHVAGLAGGTSSIGDVSDAELKA
ncbi:MAG: nucleotide sugar dehydrogenase, partial [Actinobacteria bacterium]|nr:nucleotide sugar dehydrogenase [Actinomycetota bacterium]